MIVSILQLMGFPVGKPVHSRAGEALPSTPSSAHGGAAVATDHAQVKPARRQEVKTKSGNDTKAKDSKIAVKALEKPVVKSAAKPAKPIVKPVGKAAAKDEPKSVTKPSSKTAVKASAPVVAKASIVKAPTQVVVKAEKTVVKPVAKPAPKNPVKAVPETVVPKAKTQVQVIQPVVKAATPSVSPSPVAAPAKAGRPSSRLAQLTVPSMAQAVASTAAKASYGQAAPSFVAAPVLPSVIKKDPKLVDNWKTTPVAQLTDAELLAMPDSEYMNEVQLAAFRLKLVTLKRDILSNAGETTEHLREDTSVVPDPADRATIEEEHALELRTRDRERKLLKKIEQSIGRIDSNDYGYCDETGEAIGVGRLLARPTATLSLEAQQRRELKQKMFGD
jgi:DnaK suppressor protein